MIRGVIAILGAIVPALLEWWREKRERAKDPHEIAKNRQSEIDREIIQRDSSAAAVRLRAELQEIRRRERRFGSDLPSPGRPADGDK